MALRMNFVKRCSELFLYDHVSGLLSWRVNHGKMKAGDTAGYISALGYVHIGIDGKSYLGHRIAWVIMTGRDAPPLIDHIDGCGSNNAWGNLREATKSQNAANSKKQAGKSGHLKGASWHAAAGRWQAHIYDDGKSRYLGLFDSEEKAHQAYLVATNSTYGQFARAS